MKVANLDETLVLVRAGDSMVSRRKGKEYIKGEWQLFKLKQNLKLQPLLPNFLIFTLRASLRILPTSLLKVVYKFLRKKISYKPYIQVSKINLIFKTKIKMKNSIYNYPHSKIKGPIIVAKDIIQGLVDKAKLIDVYYFDKENIRIAFPLQYL